MNKILIVIAFISFAGLGLNFSQTEITKEVDDGPVAVVKDYWQRSLKGEDAGPLLSAVPPSFNDETPRCVSDDSIQEQSVAGLPPTSFQTDYEQQDALDYSDSIREKSYQIAEVSVEREWKNEAVVWVKYHEPDKDYIQMSRFFFMTKTEAGWRVFMETSVLTLFNKEFGIGECDKE